MNNKQRVLINLFATLFAFCVQFGINFFLTPYIINELGSESYSFIPLTNNIVSYTNILTVAFYSMTARFIAIESNRGNDEKASVFFNSALLANCVLSLILIIPAAIVTMSAEHLISIPGNLVSDVKITFAFSFTNMLLSLALSAFGSVFYVKNRLDLSARKNIEGNLIRATVLILLFTLLPAKIYFLNATMLVVTLYLTMTNIRYMHRLMPEIKVDHRKFSFTAMKEMLSSGIWNSLNQASNVLLLSLDLLLANLFLGSAASGTYSVSKTVPSFVLSIVSTLIPVFAPQFVKYYAQNKHVELKQSIDFGVKCMGMLCAVPIGFLIVFGKEFLHLWVPTQNADELYPLSTLALITVAISCCSLVLSDIFTAANKLRVPAFVLFGLGIFNTVVVILLIQLTPLGIWAIPITSLITNIIRNLIFVPIYSAQCLELPWKEIYLPLIKGTACMVIMCAVCFVYHRYISATSWGGLIVAGIVCSIIACLINLMILFTKNERSQFLGKLLRHRSA